MSQALMIMSLLSLMALITVAVARLRNLVGIVILSGAYSFLMAGVMVLLDAVDVAMTEACVGAGLSTVLMLVALHLTHTLEHPAPASGWRRAAPLMMAAFIALALVYAAGDLAPFGAAATPVNSSPVSEHYLANSIAETGVPNVVTSVLASYRGFDTLGETVVIFTAAIAVLALLGAGRAGKTEKTERS